VRRRTAELSAFAALALRALLDRDPHRGLYALADRDDAHHAACVRWLAGARGPLIVPPPAIAETCYLIGRTPGPGLEATFLEAFGPWQAFTLGTRLPPPTSQPPPE
jgi:hypothetical protein